MTDADWIEENARHEADLGRQIEELEELLAGARRLGNTAEADEHEAALELVRRQLRNHFDAIAKHGPRGY